MPKLRFITPKTILDLLLAAVLCAALAPKANAVADAGPCAKSPETQQLDFWLGDWAISTPGAGPSASSKVYRALGGCEVVESWDGADGHKGENRFAWSADDQTWHGMFADNQGRVHLFLNGKVAAGSAEFTGPSSGPAGATVLNRITILRKGTGQAEQIWQKSSDNGATWTTQFRLEYTRKKS